MLPNQMVPAGLAELLQACRSCFSVRSFPIFCLPAVGMIGQVGTSTVTGILVGAGAQRLIGHDRVHRFFAEHVWSVDQLGLAFAKMVVDRFVDPGAPIQPVVDDTMFRRGGKHVAQAHWGHDASQPGHVTARGNRWVVLGIVVQFGFGSRPVCLPVLFRLWAGKGTAGYNQPARTMIGLPPRAFPDRRFDVTADAAYHGKALTDLPGRVTSTTRPPRNAVLYGMAPPPTRKRGRPRLKGERLGIPKAVAAAADTWRETVVERYGRTDTIRIAVIPCLWYGAFGATAGRLIAVTDTIGGRTRQRMLFTTDLNTIPEMIVSRYAARWSIEVAIANAKQIMGVGQARNRVAAAVERTVPFRILMMTLVHIWYALHGHDAGDAAAHRAARPWYTTKTEPAFPDMLAKCRRTIIATRFLRVRPGRQPPQQIEDDALAWELTAA